ncbi:MAG: hypothetical protein Q7J10_05270 [Methanosarcinaceae archaeon]|nr:hypothetical protein [Methanosarcinaceae archaeon]
MANLRPIKFRILELCNEDGGKWNYEIVTQIQKEYDQKGNFQRDSINFDIIELASNGLLKDIEVKVDEKGIYKKGFLLHKYSITPVGQARAVNACLLNI